MLLDALNVISDGASVRRRTLVECGVHIAIEPLNRLETYFLNTAADAAASCREMNIRMSGCCSISSVQRQYRGEGSARSRPWRTTNWIVIANFGFTIGEIAAVASIWRNLAVHAENMAFDGVQFLRKSCVQRPLRLESDPPHEFANQKLAVPGRLEAVHQSGAHAARNATLRSLIGEGLCFCSNVRAEWALDDQRDVIASGPEANWTICMDSTVSMKEAVQSRTV